MIVDLFASTVAGLVVPLVNALPDVSLSAMPPMPPFVSDMAGSFRNTFLLLLAPMLIYRFVTGLVLQS